MTEHQLSLEEFQISYLSKFDLMINQMCENGNNQDFKNYISSMKHDFLSLISQFNQSNFWQLYPKILGIDSKLQLLNFFIFENDDDEIETQEILRIVELDYKNYYKEAMGYRINEYLMDSLLYMVD
ncbi:MAG: hypothetical protein LKF43_09610 [Streptococcaceae bacterium]|nr:hypothetical protein [Streptococcaceae bacterium]